MASFEQRLDNLRVRVEALEKVAAEAPNVEMEPDPSRSPGVRVAPLPVPVNGL